MFRCPGSYQYFTQLQEVDSFWCLHSSYNFPFYLLWRESQEMQKFCGELHEKETNLTIFIPIVYWHSSMVVVFFLHTLPRNHIRRNESTDSFQMCGCVSQVKSAARNQWAIHFPFIFAASIRFDNFGQIPTENFFMKANKRRLAWLKTIERGKGDIQNQMQWRSPRKYSAEHQPKTTKTSNQIQRRSPTIYNGDIQPNTMSIKRLVFNSPLQHRWRAGRPPKQPP